jgi:hypothetical protein
MELLSRAGSLPRVRNAWNWKVLRYLGCSLTTVSSFARSRLALSNAGLAAVWKLHQEEDRDEDGGSDKTGHHFGGK